MVYEKKMPRKRDTRGWKHKKDRPAWKKQKTVARLPLSAMGPNARTGGFAHTVGGNELKFFDTTYGETVMAETIATSHANPDTVECLNAMTVGSGEQERIGRKITMQNLEINFQAITEKVTDANPDIGSPTCRVVVYLDTQNNKTDGNEVDVFNAAGEFNETSMRNMEYKNRFRILHDRTWNMPFTTHTTNYAGNTLFTGGARNWSANISLKGVDVDFSGSADPATILAITNNSIRVMAWSQGAYIHLQYQARLHFRG